MAKTVTDGNGTTYFLDMFDGEPAIGNATVFVPLGVARPGRRGLVYARGHDH